jgi:hypothetical protein
VAVVAGNLDERGCGHGRPIARVLLLATLVGSSLDCRRALLQAESWHRWCDRACASSAGCRTGDACHGCPVGAHSRTQQAGALRPSRVGRRASPGEQGKNGPDSQRGKPGKGRGSGGQRETEGPAAWAGAGGSGGAGGTATTAAGRKYGAGGSGGTGGRGAGQAWPSDTSGYSGSGYDTSGAQGSDGSRGSPGARADLGWVRCRLAISSTPSGCSNRGRAGLSEAAHTWGGRPVDLAACTRSPVGRRSAAPLGETRPARAAVLGRVRRGFRNLRAGALSGQRAAPLLAWTGRPPGPRNQRPTDRDGRPASSAGTTALRRRSLPLELEMR